MYKVLTNWQALQRQQDPDASPHYTLEEGDIGGYVAALDGICIRRETAADMALLA